MKRLLTVVMACAALMGSSLTASAQSRYQMNQETTANGGNAAPAQDRVNSHQQD